MLDWINDGLDAFARAPPGAMYYWPGQMLIAHLRATLYWHEFPDVSIDVLSRFQGHNLTRHLTAMLCTSSQIRNHCERNESYDKFLGLELSRLQRAIAMLWHPTDSDALPVTKAYTEMRTRKKNSKEARALTNANIPINSEVRPRRNPRVIHPPPSRRRTTSRITTAEYTNECDRICSPTASRQAIR